MKNKIGHSKTKTDNKNAATKDAETTTDNNMPQASSKDKELQNESATACQMKNVKDNSKPKKGRQKPVKAVDKYQPNEYQVLHCGEYLVRVLKGGRDKRRSAERRIGVKKLPRSKGQILDEKEAPQNCIENGIDADIQGEINQIDTNHNVNLNIGNTNGGENEIDCSEQTKAKNKKSNENKNSSHTKSEVENDDSQIVMNNIDKSSNVQNKKHTKIKNNTKDSGRNVKSSRKIGSNETRPEEGKTKLSLTNLERVINKAISEQNTDSKSNRKVSNEELLNDILQDPTTPAVYKKRILQALNEKYLGLKQFQNFSSANHRKTLLTDETDITPMWQSTYNVKSPPMKSDNSWIRTQSRRQISRGLSISRNKINRPLPRIVCQSNKTPRELRVPPTFRRPSTFGHSKMSKSTQTNLLILDRRHTFTRTPTFSGTQLNSSFAELPVSKFSTANQYIYHRPNSIVFASNEINNNLQSNDWNVYDCVEDNEIDYNQKRIPIGNAFSSQRKTYNNLNSARPKHIGPSRISDAWIKSDRYEDEREILWRTRQVGF